MRQYGGDIEHIGWVAEYDPEHGAVWPCSAATTLGQRAAGLSGNGMGAYVDADEETALWSMADLVQNAIAEVRTAWPWADAGGFMSAVLDNEIAVWRDRNRNTTRIGDLAGIA